MEKVDFVVYGETYAECAAAMAKYSDKFQPAQVIKFGRPYGSDQWIATTRISFAIERAVESRQLSASETLDEAYT